MIAMSLSKAVEAYVKPHITKETKSSVNPTFTLEDGRLSYQLEAPLEGGVVQPVDINSPAAVAKCRVKSVKQSAGNPNVTISQSFSKLAGSAQEGFVKLLEHANTLAAPASGN